MTACLIALVAFGSGRAVADTEAPGACLVAPASEVRDIELARIEPFDHVVLRGDVPFEGFPDIQHKADAIWSYLSRRFGLGRDCRAPEIHFHPFDIAVQSGNWTAWQKAWTRNHPVIWRDWTALREEGSKIEISQGWIDENIDVIFPFPASFLAFHYDGTNRIQINPDRTFRASMQLDPYGQRHDIDGRGYYSMGHEMLHYALEMFGVLPTKLHHCLILYGSADQGGPAIMEQVADYLVEDGIMGSSARFLGLGAERALAPCRRLSSDELREVEKYHTRLGGADSVPL